MPTIHDIQYDELGRFGVDENNRLHWDRKPVVTEERLTLAWWVNLSVVLGGLATVLLAVLETLKFFGLSGHG